MPKFLEEYHPGAIPWLAGLFEGEGSIGRRYIAITQKDTWCLYRLKAIFGGTVGNLRKDGTSQWWICGQQARDLVLMMRIHLSPRRNAQLTNKFLDDEKLAEMRLEHKERCRVRVALRKRDAGGRLA